VSDFLIYAARLQDAGIGHLSVLLHTRADRTRMMKVTPHAGYADVVRNRWPARDFELCGIDRVLERLKDDMLYSDDGPTPEKLKIALDAHPLQADDLREWFADWLLTGGGPTDEELDAVEVDEADAKRTADMVKNMLRGLNIARRRDAMVAGKGDKP
jgi:hypothetical protein